MVVLIYGPYCIYKSEGLKSSYDDVISAVDDFFDQNTLKNKPHLVKYFGSPINFSANAPTKIPQYM